MPNRTVVALAFSLGLVAVPQAAGASVATSCSFDAGTATVTAVIGSGDSPTIVRDGDTITFGGAPCGSATITNTDGITVVDGDPGSGSTLTVSLAGGRFVPGKTPEDDGTDEIEISSNTYVGPLTLIGSDVADHFYVCINNINLNSNVSGDSEVILPTTYATTTVDGGTGNDVLQTKMVASVVSGGDGDDVLYPTDGQASSYDGGPGNDELSYAFQGFASTAEIHALGGGAATIDRGSGVVDTAQHVESFEAFDGPTKFYGSADSDHFIGGRNNDWFLPMGGDDVIDGGPGIDPFGQNDVDTVSTGASAASVTFDLTSQTLTGEGTDSYSDMESLQGSPEDDRFVGDASGLLQIDGFGGYDVLDLSSADWPQSVYLGQYPPVNQVWAIGIAKVIGSDEADTMQFMGGAAPARFRGGGGDDVLVGGPLADTLRGGPGNDTIHGKGGPDTIDGNEGVDTCGGGPGRDTITHCERG